MQGGGCGVSANEYMHLYTGAQINFGDPNLYLTYDSQQCHFIVFFLSQQRQRCHGFKYCGHFLEKIQVLGFDTDQDETDRLNFCPVNKK
jgi:hypothetical protein